MGENKKINYESIQHHIGSFEELKQKLTPETVETLMNGANDGNFWDDNNLQQSLEQDVALPMKIWTGFQKLIEILGLDKSSEWEVKDLVKEFDFLSQVVIRVDLPINVEARVVAIKKIRQAFSDIGVPLDIIKASIIMKLAYIGEAEVMEDFGINWQEQAPFTVGLKLNRSNPTVDAALKEDQAKRRKKLIENDPDLTTIFDEFYKNKKPSIH